MQRPCAPEIATRRILAWRRSRDEISLLIDRQNIQSALNLCVCVLIASEPQRE